MKLVIQSLLLASSVGEFPTLPDDPVSNSWDIRSGVEGQWFDMQCEMSLPQSEHRMQLGVEWYMITEHGNIDLYEEVLDFGVRIAFLHESFLYGHAGEKVICTIGYFNNDY